MSETKFMLLDPATMMVVCDNSFSEDNFTNDLHKAKLFDTPLQAVKARQFVSGMLRGIQQVNPDFDHNLFNRLQTIEI